MALFKKFFRLIKVDEAQRIVYGLITAEREDKDGETCHYDSTVPEYKAVNAEMSKMSDGQNIMPLREMHQLHAVGAGKSIDFDDQKKEIRMAFKVVEESTWQKVLQKVLLGFSQGGTYLKRWKANGRLYYTAAPGEVSLVDNPCLTGAAIEYVKADGSIEKFTPRETDEELAERVARIVVESLTKGVKYLASPDHLPYTDASGKPDHHLMGAAWAALHGGYRGHKYEGPGKEEAIARLKEVYRREGMDTPSDKAAALAGELTKGLESPGFELDTLLTKIRAFLDESNVVSTSDTGADPMNKEQIEKCAKALGVTVEEFEKTYLPAILEKGKKGHAALAAHLKKAIAHHGVMKAHHAKMADMHKAHADHHETMAEHLDNCAKAHAAVMDGDGDAADKALKAAIGESSSGFVSIGKTADGTEVFKRAAKGEKKEEPVVKVDAPKAEGSFTKADVEKMLADALEKQKKDFDAQLEKTVAPIGDKTVRLALIDRDGKVLNKDAKNSLDPMPV